jgi:hypothetical protein
MGSAVSSLDQKLLSEEIRLCVAKAVISNTPTSRPRYALLRY